MDIALKKKLRNSKSSLQEKEPLNKICENCPHQFEVKTRSCDINDQMGFALEEPHVCTWNQDFLCRGCVEKFIMNDISWDTLI